MKEDCFAYKQIMCSVLTKLDCDGCKFYKTKKKFEADLKKYPVDKNYNKTHK